MPDNPQLVIRKVIDLELGGYIWSWYFVLPDHEVLIGRVSDWSVHDAVEAGLRAYRFLRRSRAFGTMEGHYVQ